MAMTDLAKWASNVFRLRTTALSDEECSYFVLRTPFIVEILLPRDDGTANYRGLEANVK